MKATLMLCLPRSRSAWMAHTFKIAVAAYHDPLGRCASIAELAETVARARRLSPVLLADTSASLFVDEIDRQVPDLQYLVVRRPKEDVKRSLRRQGMSTRLVDREDAALDAAVPALRERGRTLLEVPYDDINGRLPEIWTFVAEGAVSWVYAREAVRTHVEVPPAEQAQRADFGKMRRLFATIGIDITT